MPKFRDIPKITIAKYHVDITWRYLQDWIDSNKINMNPDFQRNYVWTEKQKEQYVEWILRGGNSGKEIYFNHPGWFRDWDGEMIIVDGKQRVDAVLSFLNNRTKAYGYYLEEYEDKLDTILCSFSVNVADLIKREDVLQWYLDMNTGGTYHTDEEVEKVMELLYDEKTKNLENVNYE